ncbi:MAG: protease-like activity factor CPAF [Proteobacteria bacterium]|nr:MAG: protease-like activity factor CPAF [Pseudomonadota bacterium]
MKTKSRISLYSLLALATFGLGLRAAASSVADDLTGTLYAMRGVYQTGYAPAAWKKQFAGYDLNASFDEALNRTRASTDLSQADSRGILNNFIYAMRDYHTSISYLSTESASLPLTVQTAGGRFFLAYIERSKLPETTFPFQVGDELISFGGVPAAQAVAELQGRVVANVPATDLARAALGLTSRSGAKGLAVPKGPITLGIKRQGTERVSSVQVLWDYSAEKIAPRGELQGFLNAGDLGSAPASSLLRPMMDVRLADKVAAGSPFGIGARKTFTPDLGPKVWESEETNTFYAYIYKTPDRRLIGYIRLPSYTPENKTKAAGEWAAILTRFEGITDALVIDQVNNPGGSVFYLYTLASVLAQEPMAAPRHRMAITQADVKEALDTIAKYEGVKTDEDARKILTEDDLAGYPASYEFIQFTLNQARFTIAEWEAGRKLSQPYWIGGVDHINPAAKTYSKPVLVLINHLDFSGGDFFPTILQDNKRVTVMGTRTAGAGGYVLDVKIPNNLGIDSFRYTGSIAERVDGNPIENLGVTPDLPYEITVEDLQQGYAPYKAAIQSAVDGLTK